MALTSRRTDSRSLTDLARKYLKLLGGRVPKSLDLHRSRPSRRPVGLIPVHIFKRGITSRGFFERNTSSLSPFHRGTPIATAWRSHRSSRSREPFDPGCISPYRGTTDLSTLPIGITRRRPKRVGCFSRAGAQFSTITRTFLRRLVISSDKRDGLSGEEGPRIFSGTRRTFFERYAIFLRSIYPRRRGELSLPARGRAESPCRLAKKDLRSLGGKERGKRRTISAPFLSLPLAKYLLSSTPNNHSAATLLAAPDRSVFVLLLRAYVSTSYFPRRLIVSGTEHKRYIALFANDDQSRRTKCFHVVRGHHASVSLTYISITSRTSLKVQIPIT